MDKAEFFDRMGDLAVFMDERDTLNDHIKAIAPGAYCEIGGRFIDSYIKLLSDSAGDRDNWIEWFVLECLGPCHCCHGVPHKINRLGKSNLSRLVCKVIYSLKA